MYSNSEVELSVVVLCYRSESIIEQFVLQLINEIKELDITFELVLVANYDNDPADNTLFLLREIASRFKEIVVLASEKKGGMGWDMRSGLSAASGRYIAVIDGDAQMPASDIPVVYRLIKMGGYDLVKTYRSKRYDGLFRIVLSSVYNFMFRLFFQPDFPVRDVNSKPKIFTKEAYSRLNLKSNDWFTDAEIMIQALKHNLKIIEVSTVFYKNERRGSFVGIKTILEFVFNLFKYRFK